MDADRPMADQDEDEDVVFDEDNPEWTEDDFARAVLIEQAPAIIQAAFGKSRGRPKGSAKPDGKQAVSLRLDADVLAYFRSTGPGWQTRVNEILRKAIA